MPGWGYQMGTDRVHGEAASLGLSAIEAGPEGFLPSDPADATRVLGEHDLALVGGFVPVVLHRAERREAELAAVERQAESFAAAGGEVLIVAASTGRGATRRRRSWMRTPGKSCSEGSLWSMRSATGTGSPLRCTLTSAP